MYYIFVRLEHTSADYIACRLHLIFEIIEIRKKRQSGKIAKKKEKVRGFEKLI